jgi:hypothetical protein
VHEAVAKAREVAARFLVSTLPLVRLYARSLSIPSKNKVPQVCASNATKVSS